jgi:hypothetical protein
MSHRVDILAYMGEQVGEQQAWPCTWRCCCCRLDPEQLFTRHDQAADTTHDIPASQVSCSPDWAVLDDLLNELGGEDHAPQSACQPPTASAAQEMLCQDGEAPLIDVSASPGMQWDNLFNDEVGLALLQDRMIWTSTCTSQADILLSGARLTLALLACTQVCFGHECCTAVSHSINNAADTSPPHLHASAMACPVLSCERLSEPWSSPLPGTLGFVEFPAPPGTLGCVGQQTAATDLPAGCSLTSQGQQQPITLMPLPGTSHAMEQVMPLAATVSETQPGQPGLLHSAFQSQDICQPLPAPLDPGVPPPPVSFHADHSRTSLTAQLGPTSPWAHPGLPVHNIWGRAGSALALLQSDDEPGFSPATLEVSNDVPPAAPVPTSPQARPGTADCAVAAVSCPSSLVPQPHPAPPRLTSMGSTTLGCYATGMPPPQQQQHAVPTSCTAAVPTPRPNSAGLAGAGGVAGHPQLEHSLLSSAQEAHSLVTSRRTQAGTECGISVSTPVTPPPEGPQPGAGTSKTPSRAAGSRRGRSLATAGRGTHSGSSGAPRRRPRSSTAQMPAKRPRTTETALDKELREKAEWVHLQASARDAGPDVNGPPPDELM